MKTSCLLFPTLVALMVCISCDRAPKASPGEVVIYSSIDEPYLTPLIKRFQEKIGIQVRVVTDAEATKTAALVERIEAEKSNPQADVYWGNEIFHTINLAQKGAFQTYRPKPAEDIPAKWRGRDDLYIDIGLRARMIAVSTRPQFKDQVARIHGLKDLTAPSLKGKIGICNPAFGTASGHIAAMYVLWGEPKFTAFMKALRANDIKLVGGNSVVAEQVVRGTLIAGPTDNDDVSNSKADGQQIDGILPDQGPGEDGTLLIPSTIALINGAPHSENGKKLMDFLTDPAVERELIDERYFVCSIRNPEKIRSMDVSYEECARQMRTAIETALKILQDRDAAPK